MDRCIVLVSRVASLTWSLSAKAGTGDTPALAKPPGARWAGNLLHNVSRGIAYRRLMRQQTPRGDTYGSLHKAAEQTFGVKARRRSLRGTTARHAAAVTTGTALTAGLTLTPFLTKWPGDVKASVALISFVMFPRRQTFEMTADAIGYAVKDIRTAKRALGRAKARAQASVLRQAASDGMLTQKPFQVLGFQ